MVRAAGWQPGNVDCTVIAEAPKLAPRRAEMEARLSSAVGAPVTVKAKAGRGPRRARSRARASRASPLRSCRTDPHEPAQARRPQATAASWRPSASASGACRARARRRPGRGPSGSARAAALRPASARALGRDRPRRSVGRRRDPRARTRDAGHCARGGPQARWRPRPAPMRRKECWPRQPRSERSSSTTSRSCAPQVARSRFSSSPTASPTQATSVRCSAARRAQA